MPNPTIYLPDDLYTKLDQYCRDHKITKSFFIRQLIAAFFEEQNLKQQIDSFIKSVARKKTLEKLKGVKK